MGEAYERLTGKCVTVLAVGGDNVVAIYEDAEINGTGSTIDLTAVQDEWEAHAEGWRTWEATLTTYVDGTEKWLQILDAGSAVVLSTDPGGVTFLGTAIPTAGSITMGKGGQMNGLTLKGACAPSIS